MNCRASMTEPGVIFYCTLTKGEHGDSHEAHDSKRRIVRKWKGEFQKED